MKLIKESIITRKGKRRLELDESSKLSDFDKIMKVLDSDTLSEDIEKTKSGKWVNRGKEGTHGEFKTKKAAREQQKAMFAQGYKENFNYINDIDEAQHLVDDAIERFGRVGARLYDELDEAGFYVDNDNNVKYKKELNENIGQDISEYQKWVDYDMKKYGKISDITNDHIKKAGLEVIKDQYGDYEVIAKRPVEESLKNDEIDNFFTKAKKLGVKTLKDLKNLLNEPEATGKTEKEKMDSYYKEANPEDLDLSESLYQSSSVSGNKMTFQVEDDGTFIVKDGDKEILNTKVTDPESTREQIKNIPEVETLKEYTDPNLKQDILQNIDNTSEETPTPENTGMSQLLIDAINGEWDTIKLYNDIMVNAESYGYSDIADILRDIIAEENIHVGQLQTALETISPNVSSIEKGVEEAEQQLNEPTTE